MVALFRKIVVAVLMAAWFCPGAGHAQGAEIQPTPVRTPAAPVRSPVVAPPGTPGTAAEVEAYARREQQAPHLEKFEAGARIGTTSIIIILLLVIIIILIL
jgi:hypothetical protein